MRYLYDNFLGAQTFHELQEYVMSENFPWYYQNGKVMANPENEEDFRFGHLVYHPCNGLVTNLGYDLYNLIAPIINTCDAGAVTRVKLNSDIRSEEPYYSDFHTDNNWSESQNAWTGIFYLNNNNGYTEFETGYTIASEENRLLLFRSHLKHRGVSQTDTSRRIVLNINMLLTEEPSGPDF